MFADIVPNAREELASSPSSSETSIAKENKLSGESCSCEERKLEILSEDRCGYYKPNSQSVYLLQGNFLGLA
jgi:hypothetical protein